MKMHLEYPQNVRFKCTRCGICCGNTKEKTRHILLLAEEANNIASVTRQQVSDFAVKLAGKDPYAFEMRKTTEEGKCVFLKWNRCKIYASRPLICRFYPFGLQTDHNHNSFYFTDECPGMRKGKTMREADFKKLLSLSIRLAGKRRENKGADS
jgi:Fe-S-cluster containining protein